MNGIEIIKDRVMNDHSKTNNVAQAAVFAMTSHMGQVDDDGRDYFLAHIVPVVHILEEVTDDSVIRMAGYLHDILEDTDVKYETLVVKFGQEVADLVLELTHTGQNDSVGYSFPNLKSKEAIMIKFADRLSNISRMDAWDVKRQQHYLKQSRFWRI